MPSKHVVSTPEQAQTEQERAQALRLVERLIAQSRYLREFLLVYGVSLALSKLITVVCAGLVPGINRLRRSLNISQLTRHLPPEKMDEFAGGILPSALKSRIPFMFLRKEDLHLPGTASKICAARILEHFQEGALPGHPFLDQFPGGCNPALSLAKLTECLKDFPTKQTILGKWVQTLVYDPKVRSSILRITKILSKPRLNHLDHGELQTLYEFLCRRLSTMNTFDALEKTGQLVNLVGNVCGSVLHFFAYLGVSRVGLDERIFGPGTVAIKIRGVSSRIGVADISHLHQREVRQVYAALRQLEKEAIPWQRYIERAFIVVLPLLLMIFLLQSTNEEKQSIRSGTILSLIAPVAWRLVVAAIRQLHYLTFIRGRLSLYVGATESYLRQALLVSNSSGVLANHIVVKKVQIVDDWELIQLAITVKGDKHNVTSTVMMLTIIEVFQCYGIEYTIVRRSGNEPDAIYVNAPDIYSCFAGTFGGQSRKVNQFAIELGRRVEKNHLRQYIEEHLFVKLKAENVLLGFWLHTKTEDTILEYNIRFNLEAERVTYFLAQPRVCDRLSLSVTAGGFTIRIVVAKNSREQVNALITEFTTFVNTCHPQRGEVAPRDPEGRSPLRREHDEPEARRRRRKFDADGGPAEVARVDAGSSFHPTVYQWGPPHAVYSSRDKNVFMILGTEHNKYPLFVTYKLRPEQFKDKYVYFRIREQITLARLARPRGQQGLFITQHHKKLTVKVIGANGKGDVRCEANGPLESENGALLFVVDIVVDSAHKKSKRR